LSQGERLPGLIQIQIKIQSAGADRERDWILGWSPNDNSRGKPRLL